MTESTTIPDSALPDPAFERTTEVRRDADNPTRFHADLDPSWASLRGVHGGYQSAIAVRAVQQLAPDRAVRTVSATFLRPGQVGPAVIDVEILRSSRSFTTASVTIAQEGRAVASVRTTSVVPVSGHEWWTPVHDRADGLDESVPFTPPAEILHFRQAQLLINRSTIPAADAQHARIGGHVRPLSGDLLGSAWLVMIGDWFPPSPFRRVPVPVGGVSIDYTVHLHREVVLAAGEHLEGVFETRDSAAGIALEHGTLCTADGRSVAETFHTRWTG